MADKTQAKDGLLSRRSFSDWLLTGGLFTTAASVLLPIFRFLIPPDSAEPIDSSVVAGQVGELAVNSGKIFRFGNQPGVLIHTASGEYVAFSALCTHLDCTVQYRSDFGHLWCACHNGHFDLTGRNIAGPPPRPLEQFSVEVRGEDIVVTRGAS